MWWVVCVLVTPFPENMASSNGMSGYTRDVNPFLKYGQMLDYIDSHYSEKSPSEGNLLKFHPYYNNKIRRSEGIIVPLTPLQEDVTSEDQREKGATPLDNYPKYSTEEQQGMIKPLDDDGLLIQSLRSPNGAANFLKEYARKRKDYQVIPTSTRRRQKYFNLPKLITEFDTTPTRSTTHSNDKTYFDDLTEQATMGDKSINTIQSTNQLTNTFSILTAILYPTQDTPFYIGTEQFTTNVMSVATYIDSTLSITIDLSPFYTDKDYTDLKTSDVTDDLRRYLDNFITEKEDTKFELTQIQKTTEMPQARQLITKDFTMVQDSTTTSQEYIYYDNETYSATPIEGINPTEIEALQYSVTQSSPTLESVIKTDFKESTALTTIATHIKDDAENIKIHETNQYIKTDTTLTIGEESQSTFIELKEVTATLSAEPDKLTDLKKYIRKLEPSPFTTTTEDYSKRKIDIPELLKLLDSVVYDDPNRFNLTQKFNESLQKYNIPTCETIQGTTESTTEPPSTINFNDAKVVAKCFVCGLDTEGIPRSSACADAFAGDFIPLVPVDAKARGKIAMFRKYCRYLDVNRVIITEEEPHSVFGRFTGGCSVRWVDLTNVYTQRSCRNRRRAVMGKHFASKRMAKLEMALNDIDNGCIISPVATLLPLSRAISLYARFHACVCTGSWCNKAVATTTWITITNNLILFVFVAEVS